MQEMTPTPNGSRSTDIDLSTGQPAPQPYLEEPAFLGREFPGRPQIYRSGPRLFWFGPALFFSAVGAVWALSAGNTPALLGCVVVFFTIAVLAFLAIRRQIQRDMTQSHPRRYE
jgi:hypothetical protein